jgi:hypothetical protein
LFRHNGQNPARLHAGEFSVNIAQGIEVRGNIAEAAPGQPVFSSGGTVPNRVTFANNRLFPALCGTFKHEDHDIPSPANNTMGVAINDLHPWWNSYWAAKP